MAVRHAPLSPPAAEMTWPGICQHLEIAGHPAAGEVTLDNGVPVVVVILGDDLARSVVELKISTLAEMDELVRAVQHAHSRLAMWHQDHRIHPFGDEVAAA